ncbi:hypothetical protein ACSZOP_06395 [Colibacter massiliensis]|uniref:hypothetical protein n=1 Tax=Colibacter massiliensis TaxID=1852379 RepID=UPI003F9122F1
MTRLVRLNEVQYTDSDYRKEQLLAEGFVIEELNESNAGAMVNTDEAPDTIPDEAEFPVEKETKKYQRNRKKAE